MGYRSDVTIVMYPKRKEDFALLKLYADETFPDQFDMSRSESLASSGTSYEGVDVYTRAEWEFRDEAEPDDELSFTMSSCRGVRGRSVRL
jgi:hypothetical protein